MQIFGGSLRRGRRMTVGLSKTANFSVFAGHFFGNFRDTASFIVQRYGVPHRLFNDPKMHDLEWPSVALLSEILFSRRFVWRPTMRLSKIIAWKLIKIDPHYQWRKSSAGTLVSGDIRFMGTINNNVSQYCTWSRNGIHLHSVSTLSERRCVKFTLVSY